MTFSSLCSVGRTSCRIISKPSSICRQLRRYNFDSISKKRDDRQRILTISLYRSLLRNAKQFSFSPKSKILSSLLHRTGIDEILPSKQHYETNSDCNERSTKDVQIDSGLNIHNIESMNSYFKDKANRVPLNRHEAQDLSRGYVELQRIHHLRTHFELNRFSPKYDDSKDPIGEMKKNANLLFRSLLKETLSRNESHFFYNGMKKDDIESASPFMRFPCQINLPTKPTYSTISYLINDYIFSNSDSNNSSNINIKKQHHLTLWDIIRREFRADHIKDRKILLPSNCFSYESRFEAALMALKELNQKKTYAHFPKDDFELNSSSKGSAHTTERNQIQAAKGVTPLSFESPSDYLKPGTFLIAHPFLAGYFANTVICLLDHTDEIDKNNKMIDTVIQEKKYENAQNRSSDGGTYGLVINRNAIRRRLKPVHTQGTTSSNTRKESEVQTALLKEVLRSDSLPEGFRAAFGDCEVREGGPVNLSVQMMHTCSPNLEEKLQIGGRVLSPTNASYFPVTMMDGHNIGTPGGLSAKHEEIDGFETPAGDSDHAIFFQGDIIKAAQAVIDGDLKKKDFSFVVGASCWESGQLQREVMRGYWMPVSGPVEIAFDGDCLHEKSFYEAKPQKNLWLSMMCAIGEDEANLAHLTMQKKEVCEVCDDF